MALHFDFANIKDQTIVNHPHREDEWHPVGYQLALLSMPCGYREITEKNLDEVTERVMAYQLVAGFVLARPRGLEKSGVYITPDDVKAYIGLTTNAGVKSRSEFVGDLGLVAMRQGQFQRNEGTINEKNDFVPYTAIDIFNAK